jgi:DMSO/TMAO reductase YedYZ molybdopterin-dependent catalytic subunit
VEQKMRIMSEKPLNAETPLERLRSWITANSVFFARNQGEIPAEPVPLESWELFVEGNVKRPLRLTFGELLEMPRAIVANTLECSGNSRSLLREPARGNPWTVGGVGNAVWGGVWLKDVLDKAGLTENAGHVAFEGFEKPLGSAGIKFIRSIPLEKAIDSTMLAYEMNGEPLPLKHGFPMRGLALGWTGANCVKWLHRITVLERPYQGFYMDKVYRVFEKDREPETGSVVTAMKLKSIITRPANGGTVHAGTVIILGAAWGGEHPVAQVEVSTDGGKTWLACEFIGPSETYSWRQFQYRWEVKEKGGYILMTRATDTGGRQQPGSAVWNVLGYGNNGVGEHGVRVTVV